MSIVFVVYGLFVCCVNLLYHVLLRIVWFVVLLLVCLPAHLNFYLFGSPKSIRYEDYNCQFVYTCVHVCMCACVYVCMCVCVYVCMCVCVYVCMCVCVYVCMCACVHVCMYVYVTHACGKDAPESSAAAPNHTNKKSKNIAKNN